MAAPVGTVEEALKFSDDYIEHLREINPFRSYGYDSSTYAGNIESMFQRMKSDAELMQNVDFVAHYIKHEVSAANLPELDLVQFALNFCLFSCLPVHYNPLFYIFVPTDTTFRNLCLLSELCL